MRPGRPPIKWRDQVHKELGMTLQEAIKQESIRTRGVRGHRQKNKEKQREIRVNVKNRLKIQEKAEILAKKNSKKREISWKEELSHPCRTEDYTPASKETHILGI